MVERALVREARGAVEGDRRTGRDVGRSGALETKGAAGPSLEPKAPKPVWTAKANAAAPPTIRTSVRALERRSALRLTVPPADTR